MASPTRRILTPDDVAALARRSFGSDCAVVDCGPLSGGEFAAVWWVRLDDGRTVVLKTSPPAAARLLRYERDLLDAEVGYYRLVAQRAPEVPVPRVLAHDHDPALLDGSWAFMTMLPGRNLATLRDEHGDGLDDEQARRDLGATVARLHTITSDRFGYVGDRSSADTWPDAFEATVEDLLADGVDWGVELAVSPDDVRRAVRRHRDALAEVTTPALVLFDCWDGNVLVDRDEAGTLRLSGMVDPERYLYGDPLVDFVSPVIFRHLEDEPEHPFALGYGPVIWDEAARTRLALYRLQLYLLMNVEMPSRGMNPENEPWRFEHLPRILREQLAAL